MYPAMDNFPIIYCFYQCFCAEATDTLLLDVMFIFLDTFFDFYLVFHFPHLTHSLLHQPMSYLVFTFLVYFVLCQLKFD